MIAAAKTPVTCASCGRQAARRGRRQLYCSTRCRKRGHRAKSAAQPIKFAPRYPHSGGRDDPSKKRNKFKALQRAKSLSSHPILAPARVLAIEVFARSWQEATSSAGIAIQVSRIRPRALVDIHAPNT
jgi:hypothetical protein